MGKSWLKKSCFFCLFFFCQSNPFGCWCLHLGESTTSCFVVWVNLLVHSAAFFMQAWGLGFVLMRMSLGPPGAPGAHPVCALPLCLLPQGKRQRRWIILWLSLSQGGGDQRSMRKVCDAWNTTFHVILWYNSLVLRAVSLYEGLLFFLTAAAYPGGAFDHPPVLIFFFFFFLARGQ